MLDYYAEFKQTGCGTTDHSLKVRIAKCEADLIEALGSYEVSKQPIQTITRKNANAYRDTLAGRMSANPVARYKNTLNAAYN